MRSYSCAEEDSGFRSRLSRLVLPKTKSFSNHGWGKNGPTHTTVLCLEYPQYQYSPIHNPNAARPTKSTAVCYPTAAGRAGRLHRAGVPGVWSATVSTPISSNDPDNVRNSRIATVVAESEYIIISVCSSKRCDIELDFEWDQWCATHAFAE